MTTEPLLQTIWLMKPLSIFFVLFAACGPPPQTTPDAGPGPSGLDDHTVLALESIADFEDNKEDGTITDAVKFVISNFARNNRRIRYMDSQFFALHDEWYWFRLMNGARVPGDETTTPFFGQRFATIADIVAFAEERDSLPLDLRFVGDRLYSPRFYELALRVDPRPIAVGTLLHAQAREGRDEVWAFELEYQDAIRHDELVVFFNELERTLPAAIYSDLRWLIRSPNQEALAVTMESDQLQFHDRLMRYSELAIVGEVEVYSEGLTAGRLHIIPSGETITDTRATDVLVLGDIPDELPPAVALLTAVPQTPLAHINLLAQSRGIPNAYLGGITDDPNLDQLARVRAPVVILARAPDELVVQAISETDYARYRSLSANPAAVVPAIDLTNAPYTLNLADLALADINDLRPLIGGKAAGFLALQAPGDVIMPDTPMVITARAYHEHMADLEDEVQLLEDERLFRTDFRVRYYCLEGEDDYLERFVSSEDVELLDTLPAALRIIGQSGGIKGILRAKELAPATKALLHTAVETQFADFGLTQGLRFRSSSSIEDIEGFNGAGLYTSNTGYLDPVAAGKAAKKTIERALKKTWSSYWGTEAYEERRLANIEHLAGNMAVLVHARFDDDHEVTNGVFTLTIRPDELTPKYDMVLNVQKGFLSVTNPPPGVNALPEIDRVTETDGTVVIDRVARSTESATDLLSDAKLQEIFASATAVTEAWLQNDNDALFSAQQSRTLTLDFEFREMATGWPALAIGQPREQRIVIKQARSLEPGTFAIDNSILGLPLPRDIVARARIVERRVCTADSFTIITTEAYTDPLSFPDLGHNLEPFNAFITIETTAPILGYPSGERFSVIHTSYASVAHPGLAEGGAWSLDIDVDAAAPAFDRLASISLDSDGSYDIARAADTVSGTWSGCESSILLSTPEEFLRSLIVD